MSPLMKLGYQKFLTIDDLWNLKSEDQSKKVSELFEAAWNKELKKKKLISFFIYIYIVFNIFNIFSLLFLFLCLLLVHHC